MQKLIRTAMPARASATLALAACLLGAPLRRDTQAADAALLLLPRELHIGGPSALTVTTLDSVTREPSALPVVVQLLDGETPVSVIYTGATGSTGHVRVPFEVPALPPGAYTAELQVAGIDAVLRVDVTLSSAPAILIETDKPIYKPSQTILGRVVLVDNALRPRAGDVELAIHDAKGIRVDRRELSVGEFGAAEFSLDLADEVNFGTWKVRARSEDVESVRDIRVEEYTLPRFDLGVEVQRRWALVDEPVAAAVFARYFFGRDVEGTAVVTAERWVGVWEEYHRAEGPLEEGRFAFELPAVGFVAGSPQESGQGAVTLKVEVTDSTGHTQSVTDTLTILQAPVVLGLVPQGRTLKPEIPLDVVLTARSPDGEPLDTTVATTTQYYDVFSTLLASVDDSVEARDGVGMFSIVPPPDTFYARVAATAQRDGHTATAQIQIDSSYSTGGHYLSLSTVAEEPVSVGEFVTCTVLSSNPGTVYYEVYAGGRTVLSDATESRTFSFAVSPEMVPLARVVAYQIQPDNEVAADSLDVAVEISGTISVTADFDREEARPGESIEVVIDAGTFERTLLGVSVVDQSVLALGRSRLHLAEVFAELERRFLEPQVEVHEGGAPPGGGPVPVEDGVGLLGPFGIPRSVGARETLEEAGLQVVATPNLTVTEGARFNGWPFAEDVDVAAGPPREGDEISEPPGGVRVRQHFPETWVWEPLLFTDEGGLAILNLTVPDSITGWKLAAVGTGPSGMGFGEAELKVFQEFFVEPSLPYSVTRGEEFPVKVDLFNYLESAQEISLTFGSSEWYELLGEGDRTVTVPANSATSVRFPIRPVQAGEHPVEVTAIGSLMSDAVKRTLRVVPEGLPVENVLNSVLQAGDAAGLDVTFPEHAVADSERAFLHVTPSPVAQTMNGVSDLLGMPFGCGEQNMIFLAPDIEILKYLREVGELSPEIRAQAEYFVNVGYQRELTYQADDGGFSAFGGPDGSLWLTSFVLWTFAGAREVRDIDESVLARAADMLMSRQETDGSFRTDQFLIHKEMDGGMANTYAMAAYVTNALADYGDSGKHGGTALEEALARAATYLATNRSRVNDDPYSLSIAAVALQKVPGSEAEAALIIERLLDLAIREDVGMHWEPYPVETTGYAALALLGAGGGSGHPEVGSVLDWLSTQRNSLGGYGQSTQDTVLAIRALFASARQVRRDVSLDLALRVGDEVIWSLHVDETNFDVLHSTDLPLADSDGGRDLMLQAVGTGSVGYQVVKRFNVPGEHVPPSRDMILTVEYDTEGIETDDVLDVNVRLLYTGPKEATGMVIADIGIPTGFAAVTSTLEALVEGGKISRFDVAGRKIILYIDSLVTNEPLELTFQMRALYPVKAEGPLSRMYEYYDPEVRGYDQQQPVEVRDPSTEEPVFIRGDTNDDMEVDLADAVTGLHFLFLGETVRCEDAVDANDDGELDLTDPIYILLHLYQGGRAPLPPYPGAGVDETPDSLICLSPR